VTPFFFPCDPALAGEDAYLELRRQTELHMGRAPRQSRISEMWSRRGSLDCVTRVGAPDPITGDIVTAIFDMGPHQPFVVYRQDPDGFAGNRFEVLATNAYSITEFDG
jgi:hypothetical protein